MSPNKSLLEQIDELAAKQLKWRRIMSGAYFLTSAVAIVSSGAAAVVAGLGYSKYAAILAGLATALFALEKAMLFREKWSHHLNTSSQIEALRIECLYGDLPDKAAAQRLREILTTYAVGLPMATRPEGG